MYGPFARSDYYGVSAPSRAFDRRCVYPTNPMDLGQRDRCGMVPTFTTESIDEGGAHLDPDSIATVTPRAFTVASPPARLAGFEVDHLPWIVVHCIPARIHQI